MGEKGHRVGLTVITDLLSEEQREKYSLKDDNRPCPTYPMFLVQKERRYYVYDTTLNGVLLRECVDHSDVGSVVNHQGDSRKVQCFPVVEQ